MKRIVLLILLVVSGIDAICDTTSVCGATGNRFAWGVSIEESCWLEDMHEWLPRLSTEALVPCGERLSLGAFVSTVFLEWEAGLMASWRFDGNHRVMLGMGYSDALYVPLIKLGYKTRRAWYFTGTLGLGTSVSEMNVGLGVGYFIIGGRNKKSDC